LPLIRNCGGADPPRAKSAVTGLSKFMPSTAPWLAPGGTIAIAEHLVDADRRGPMSGLIFAVNMLVNTEAGGVYSFEEIAGWLTEAGLVNPRQLPAPGPSPLILATRS
jgi:hypothetical protein